MQKFANAARSNLALGINNAVTSFSVTAGTGAKFPTLGAGDWFYATIQEGDTLEIVKVTARSTDTFTVVRAQNGTTASAFTTAAVVGLRPVAADFDKAVGFQTACNVLSYGADATGTVNSSAAIQAAIDAAYADGGGLVEIPAGAYLLTAELETYPTVTIRGASRRATVLKANTNGMRMIFCDTPGAGIVIQDMTLVANEKSSVTGIQIHGISSARISNIFLSDLELLGGSTQMLTGIDLEYCANAKMDTVWMSSVTTGVLTFMCADVDIISVTAQWGTGFGFSINGDGTIGGGSAADEGCRLVGCSTNGQHGGLSIVGQDWGTASSCSFTTAVIRPLYIEGSWEWKFSACEFSSNGTVGGSAAWVKEGTFGGDPRDSTRVQFVGCTFSIATYGIFLNGLEHVVSGCTFTECGNGDLWLGHTRPTSYCAVSGCTFSSVSSSARIVEGNSGVTANYNSFVGNTIKLGGGPGLLQVSGSGANSLPTSSTSPATLNVLYA